MENRIRSWELFLYHSASDLETKAPLLSRIQHPRHITLGRTPLDEWPARRKDLLPDNTQQSQETNIHIPGGIRTHILSRRAASDPSLRPHGRWDWPGTFSSLLIVCHNRRRHHHYHQQRRRSDEFEPFPFVWVTLPFTTQNWPLFCSECKAESAEWCVMVEMYRLQDSDKIVQYMMEMKVTCWQLQSCLSTFRVIICFRQRNV